MSKEIDFAKLAEQFDQLAETMSAISGTFRSAGGSAKGGSGDAETEKPVRSKAAKPAAKSKPAPADDDEETTITEDQVRAALKGLADVKGKDAMAEALASVGAGRLPDVDENDYPALMKAVKEALEAEDEVEEKPAAKSKGKAKAKAKAAPDYDDIVERFKQLAEQDKAAAKKVLKGAGLGKLSEIDQDDEDAMTSVSDAINAALEAEDDDLV